MKQFILEIILNLVSTDYIIIVFPYKAHKFILVILPLIAVQLPFKILNVQSFVELLYFLDSKATRDIRFLLKCGT